MKLLLNNRFVVISLDMLCDILYGILCAIVLDNKINNRHPVKIGIKQMKIGKYL